MIHCLEGKIGLKAEKFLVINVGGVGYKVFCSTDTLGRVLEGQTVRIFTAMCLKEDAAELYGFLTSEELAVFDILNGISGIGPKTALVLASLGSLEKLKEIMEKGRLPREIKGIGLKRMQKILLELTGQIKEVKRQKEELSDDGTLEALVSLGFSKQKAKDALAGFPNELAKEEKLRKAIKLLGKGDQRFN